MPSCVRGLLDHERHACRTFLQSRVRTIPGERPAPVETDFIVRIDNIVRAKLMTENFRAILCNRDGKGFSLPGPISVAHQKRVLALARNVEILVQRPAILISTRSRGVPFTLAALCPLG